MATDRNSDAWPEPANQIVFLSDNHNAAVAGCYGHPIVRTPNLDAIAAGGVRFENSYSASTLCCPARASLATGRFPHQTGYWDNAIAYDGRVAGWAHRLREAGQATVSVGKLHYRSTDDDNGFEREIVPMHIVDGVGALSGLLRWSDEQPPMPAQWELYWERSGVGETEYQAYDRQITTEAIAWLEREGRSRDRPFTLLVSYVSSHPPFLVPERLFSMYRDAPIPLPVAYRPGERSEHPAIQFLRELRRYHAMDDEAMLRRVAAGYFALVTHLDEQIGEVMAAARRLGLLERTRLFYTSDHGESYGHHGLFGKNHLMEPAARVPLLASGPGIPVGRVVRQTVSAVDLFPTLLESAGVLLEPEDADLAGTTLWPALRGHERHRIGFAEFHASASRAGSFMWRDGRWKLICHAGMPNQLFDLAVDPMETRDLAGTTAGAEAEARLEAALRRYVDPEAVDARAKADQHAMVERHGGNDAVRDRGNFVYTPPPGHVAPYRA